MDLNIGILIDNFQVPVPEGLKLCAEFGAQSFQVFITKGEMLAANMSKSARADFVKLYKDLELEISATCGDFGLNFGDADRMKQMEPALRDAVVQTADLGASIMTTHIGRLGDDPEGASERAMIDTLKHLGDYAAGHGVVLATETGLESGPRLRGVLERADTRGVAVNFDPANLVMNGFDHMEAVRALFPFIVHTHAKDGVRENGAGRQTLLGQGGVDFPAYVGLLTELGYEGAYTIEREAGDDRIGDIRKAVEFLKSLRIDRETGA